jgi:hypothetical protein
MWVVVDKRLRVIAEHCASCVSEEVYSCVLEIKSMHMVTKLSVVCSCFSCSLCESSVLSYMHSAVLFLCWFQKCVIHCAWNLFLSETWGSGMWYCSRVAHYQCSGMWYYSHVASYLRDLVLWSCSSLPIFRDVVLQACSFIPQGCGTAVM